ncbi:MAG TPA: TatD family hydrolase [Gammaproteobacteria bacterium]|nr:TatD family hydrolase [Gammaproteobacteria bacterium]
MHCIDIGANLTHDSFDYDRDAVIERARAVGVETMIVTGADVAGSKAALELARECPHCLFATAGVHPHHAADYDGRTTAQLRVLASHVEVVAIGECGLDYFRNFSPRPAQETAFAAQLELAAELGMPVFMHQRDAHADFIDIYDRYRSGIVRGVVHCFTGTAEELDDYIARDLYIGITGWICDERRGLHLREFVDRIPADRLMIETDAPYLLPRDLKPKPATRRNEPVHLPHIARVLAECRGDDLEQLAAQTTANAQRFFALRNQENQQHEQGHAAAIR